MKTLLSIFLSLTLLLNMSATDTEYNYGEVLQKSIFFYECQQAGELPDWNRVSWRGNSAMNDGQEEGLDLTGGWYDAGDHVKFNFPMAFTTTALAWGALEFEQGYKEIDQYDDLLRNLRFVNDYFIKCHPSPNVLWGQVGNGGLDHAWWGSAEVMKMDRPAYKIDANNPGSDLAGETAAAMAASSMLFKDSDPTYSAELLKHAKELYTFATTYKGVYHESITDATSYYKSWSGYNDELVWSAIWLYKATGEATYLADAKAAYANLAYEPQSTTRKFTWSFAWDDKTQACYVLMAQLTGEQTYKDDAERHLDYWCDDTQSSHTAGGLAYVDPAEWGPLRYAANISMLAFVYSDIAPASKKQKYLDFGYSQIDYALGSNPEDRSYVCGFGKNPPVNPHHRTVHGTWTNNLTKEPITSRHILYGALVGGPGTDDGYEDDRGNYYSNEVACDYNACFTGCVAKMVETHGGSALSNFPVEEEPTDEFYCDVKINASSDRFSELAIYVRNHSAWPARTTDKLSIRYYIDITEGVENGLEPGDYEIALNNAQGAVASDLIACDEANNIYYIEVSLAGIEIWPGGESPSRHEVQLRVGVPTTAPVAAWDASNDYSYEGIGSTLEKNDKIPVYDDGMYLAGEEHCDCAVGTSSPRARFTVTPTIGMNPMTVNVDATTSTGPEDVSLSYAWDFGDGSSANGMIASHVYNMPGEYVIELTVSGNDESHKATANISVKDVNSPPVASFVATPNRGAGPLEVSFDASDSYIISEEDLTYSWDFGDGATGTGVAVTHTYTDYEQYTVVLTVSHVTKGEDTETTTISVLDPSLTGDLKLQYRDNSSSESSINSVFNIINEGDEAVDLADLSIRYWYTLDVDKDQDFACYYAQIGASNVEGAFVKTDKATSEANYYLELTFKSGTITGGSNSGEIQSHINVTSWASDFDLSNDYSFNSNASSFTEWEQVTLYQNGILVYGIEPSGINQDVPTSTATQANARVKVFPNPSKNNDITINLGAIEGASVNVYNLSGVAVYTHLATGSYHIIPNGVLRTGVYFVSVKSKGVNINRKLIIE